MRIRLDARNSSNIYLSVTGRRRLKGHLRKGPEINKQQENETTQRLQEAYFSYLIITRIFMLTNL